MKTPKVILRLKDPRRFQRAWLSDEEYEFLLDDIEQAIRESNTSFLPKPTKSKPPIILSEKDRANCLVCYGSGSRGERKVSPND